VTNTVVLTQTALQFGAQTDGVASTNLSVSIYNEGTSTLTFGSSNAFAITGANAADFAISNNNCGSTLGAGGGCTVYVMFTPSIVGTEMATLQITDGAPGSPQQVLLLGVGQASTQNLEFEYSSLTFGPTNIGATTSQVGMYLSNIGTATVTLTNFAIAGANAGDFAISTNNCGTTLTAGNYCYVYITFSPTAVGARNATLQVTDTATGSPQTVSLFGTGQTPVQAVTLEYSSLTFPAQTVGTTSSQQLDYIYNTGNEAISFSSFNISGTNASEFAISNNGCGSSVAAGSYCYVYVTFTPAGTGLRSATLQITDTATGSPQVISLFGTGQ